MSDMENGTTRVSRDLSEVTIESERLILRPISLEYDEDIFREFHDEVTQYLIHGPDESIEQADEFITESVQQAKHGASLKLVATSKQGEFLGLIELKKANTKTPEFGLWLKVSAQGKGFGPEMVNALYKWASQNLDVDYFEYRADADNDRSWKIAEKLVAENGGKYAGETSEEVRGQQRITKLYKILPNKL